MRIEKFIQTPFVNHNNENQIYIKICDWDFCNSYKVEVSVDGIRAYGAKIFAEEFNFLIPAVDKATDCTVKITPFEDTPIFNKYTIKPPKKWQIPLLFSSHEDLGYCGYIEKLHKSFYEDLKCAMELCERHSGFKYMIEHYWWLDAFDCYATAEEKKRLKKLFSEQKIELNAPHSGVHTHWADSEQLVRSMYFSCRDAKKKYGVTPKCAIYTDLSGITQAAIPAFSEMGIKYCGILSNGFRNYLPQKFPPLFWWKAKNGKQKLLCWYQQGYKGFGGLTEIWCNTKRQYSEGEFVFDTTKVLKTEKWFTNVIERLGSTECDIFPVSFYDDREMPTTLLLTVCEEMNKKWKYPEFKMEIPSVFFSEIESKYGDTLPVLSGDIADQWADFITIAPELTSKKRETSRMLYDAEMLSALENSATYDRELFRSCIFDMCMFDEHCWATSSKHPQAMHKHNIKKVKSEPVLKSYDRLRDIIENTLQSPQNNGKISLINTIPQYRSSSLRNESGTVIPKGVKHQILPDGKIITAPFEFDGIGIKKFDGVAPTCISKEILSNTFETPYYKVKFNRESKTLTSILDKETDRELIDKNSRFELGQFIYAYTESKLSSELSFEVPKKQEFAVFEGEVAFVIVQKGFEEQSGAEVETQICFYKNEKNIEFDLSFKNAYGLLGDFYDRYKKNYFFSFPFKVDNAEFYTENACGEINEKTDKVKFSANDFAVTKGWSVAENSDGGIALYTKDMPVFYLGDIKYNRFNPDFNAEKAHFFLYAASNRCNNLIYSKPEECKAEYHISVLPYKGKHIGTVPKWSNEKQHSLLLGGDNNLSIPNIKIENCNVFLVSLKGAEDCENAFVLRFIETSGKDTETRVKIPVNGKKAFITDNCENDLLLCDFEKDTVSFKINAFSYLTLKIYC